MCNIHLTFSLECRDEENSLQFETNFFGPARLIRSLLPGMRARKIGTIVNVSSIAGQDGLPSCGMYAGSKSALEGLSEALAREIEPFNISVLIVEPGMFRTHFMTAAQVTKKGVSEPYSGGAVEKMVQAFGNLNGTQRGDREKGVARIFEVVTCTGAAGALKGKILRLPLGPDCLVRFEKKAKSVSADLEAAREAAMSTDIGG